MPIASSHLFLYIFEYFHFILFVPGVTYNFFSSFHIKFLISYLNLCGTSILTSAIPEITTVLLIVVFASFNVKQVF